jgi:hypothetical protein
MDKPADDDLTSSSSTQQQHHQHITTLPGYGCPLVESNRQGRDKHLWCGYVI